MLNKLQKIIFLAFVILFPVFCLSYYLNPFDLPKIFLLMSFIGILLFILGVEIAINGKLSLKVSRLDIPLLLLSLAYLFSGILKTSNKMEAFLFPGTATLVFFGFLVYFFGKTIFENKKEEILTSIFFSGLVVSLFSILSFVGVFSLISFLPAFLKDPNFSSVGGKLPEIIFLVSILPLGVSALIKEKDLLKRVLYGLSILLIVVGVTLNISFVLPGKPTTPVLATIGDSWVVMTSSLKESPILGAGAGNYLSAYTKFVPLSHNSSPFWSVRFPSANNFVFTLITETGLLGLVAFAIVTFLLISIIISKFKNAANISLLILIVSFFLFPTNAVLIILFFLLALNVSKDKSVDLKVPKLASSLIFFISIFLCYLIGRAQMGEVLYKKAIDAISKNDGKTSYDTLRKAITLNSYVDRYHATYSQVNLALAQNLSQKEGITEMEKETVAQLIQQAIREAKAIVTLNPERAANWELLATTYQGIIPFAQGADEFTIQTFNQAIALDPTNPNLRIGLGETYFALGRYDEAVKAFELAVAAKPDLANSHYNLAIALRGKGDIERATQEMNTTLSLLDMGSLEYETVKKELENLDNFTPSKETGKPTTTPQIQIPQELQPGN